MHNSGERGLFSGAVPYLAAAVVPVPGTFGSLADYAKC